MSKQCDLPPLSALTIAVFVEPDSTMAVIKADFRSKQPSLMIRVPAQGALTVVRGGAA